jgi:hypothetical protein
MVTVVGLRRHHPDSLTSRNNLASAYLAVGRRSDAIALFKQTLGDSYSERILDAKHPLTQTVRRNLAGAQRGRR